MTGNFPPAFRLTLSRRRFIAGGSASFLGMSLFGSLPGCGGGEGSPPAPTSPATTTAFLLPSEDGAHAATYMAFASAADGIWAPITPQSANAGLLRVQQDLMDVAKAVAAHEPVILMVLPVDLPVAQAMLATASAANPGLHAAYLARTAGVGGISLLPVDNGFNDFWTRDTGCLFVKDTANGNRMSAITFNFNGWGNANTTGVATAGGVTAPVAGVPPAVLAASNRSKAGKFFQPFDNDKTVAGWMAAAQHAALIPSTLTLEGGAIEVDGEGTAIITESSVLHVNRNPQLFSLPDGAAARAVLRADAKATVLAELQRTLGVRKILWIPGTAIFPSGAATPDAETDITNGHTDFYAKFLAPGVVAYAFDGTDATGEKAVTAANLAALTGRTDAQGRALTLVPLHVPTQYGTSAGMTLNDAQKANFAAGYINFYPCNGAIILPKFNDTVADAAAVEAIRPYAGTRTLVQVDILGIASGGGGLHCATRQLPA